MGEVEQGTASDEREPVPPELRVDGYRLDLIRLLAADPRNGLCEIRPGVYTTQRDGWGSTS